MTSHQLQLLSVLVALWASGFPVYAMQGLKHYCASPQTYTSVYSVEQELKGHLQAVEEKQKAQQTLEASIADTQRRIDGLLKKTEESRQVGCRAVHHA
jgi:hypothetical protein